MLFTQAKNSIGTRRQTHRLQVCGLCPGDFRLTNDGVDAVFDGIGTESLMRSYKALRTDGRLIGYGFGSKSKDRRSRAGQIVSNAVNWISVLALNLIPDSTKVIPYSIQTLKRRKPDWFHFSFLR